MQGKVVGLVLAMLLLAPIGQAQWIQDEEGDTDEGAAGQSVAHGRSGGSDIFSVDIEEGQDDLTFIVKHSDLPDPAIALADNVNFDLEFSHGDIGYLLDVSYSKPIDGDARYYSTMYEAGDYSTVFEPEVEAVEGGFSVTVSKDRIVDEYGARPTAGVVLKDFTIESHTIGGPGICISSDGCITAGVYARDHAPDDEESASYIFQHGLAQDGDVRLRSPAPVRWSNGEATTFVYEVTVENRGDDADTVAFRTSDVPSAWTVAQLGPVTLAPGEERPIPFPVKVPFGHVHGSDPRFLLEAIGASGTGRIELGVHYPEIPQPTGHHAQVYLHTRELNTDPIQGAIYAAAGGNYATQAYINTAEEHVDDESIPVLGSKNNIGGDIDKALDGEVPDYGVIYEWAVPLSPGLRVGLLADGNTTDGQVELGFDIPVGEVRVYGRLAAATRDATFDTGFNMEFDVGHELAIIPATDLHSVSERVVVPFSLEGQGIQVPFDSDQELILFLAAHVVRPDAPLTPNTGVYLLEGEMVLPLKEFHDAVPVDVSFPEDVENEAVQSLDDVAPVAETKDAPAIGPAALLVGIGLAAWRRRELA